MFVLLSFHNDYNQHGGYFAGIFDTREAAESSVHHIGRVDYEDRWYEVLEVKPDVKYDELEEDGTKCLW